MTIAPGTQIDRYEILGEIGEGGMAVVYRARHTILHSAHAIKILHEQFVRQGEIRERFLNEGRIQAQLRHPYITPITDIIALPGVAGLVMPLLQGQDLDDHIRGQGALPVSLAVAWTHQILSALAYVHGRGIIHRDLKPANIFVEQNPAGADEVRLMDFGIAKLIDSTRTRTAMALGTPAYMSPEQIRSPRDVDARTDLFATGAILYEMITGRPAFQGDTEFDIQSRIVGGRFQPLPTERDHIPGALGGIIERALSVEPAARFQTATDFAAALSALGTPARAPAPPPAAPQATAAPPSPAGPTDSVLRSQLVSAVTVPGRWVQDPDHPTSWLLVDERGVQKARAELKEGALHLRIRHNAARGGQAFIPRASTHPFGWPEAARANIDRLDWYSGKPWQAGDVYEVRQLAWLINQEWADTPSAPEPAPPPAVRPPPPEPSVPLVDTYKAKPLVSKSERRQVMGGIGAMIGFVVGLPAGGIGALPAAMIGGLIGYWLPEIGCVVAGLLGVAFAVILFALLSS